MTKYIIHFLLLFALLAQKHLMANTNGVDQNDSLALVDLYNNTGGQQWANNYNWLTSPVDKWFGITVTENRVTEIDLRSNNLTDTLPPSFQNLTEITRLLLYSNKLSGPLPAWLGELSQLEYIHFAGNKFSGQIPPELGKLSNLKYLHLNSNQLEGSIPPEMGQLSNLINLYLHGNKLTGNIPASFGNLQNLSRLYLYSNQLNGSIPPELGNLQELYVLYLHNNEISGSIPPELGQLENLANLYLNNNKMSGELPAELGNMERLSSLQINNNNFDGSIPPEWGQLTNLRNLYLQMNQLKGNIPPEIGQLTHLVNFDLSLNLLSGIIPPELGNLTNLQTLDFSINQLTGNIPPELGNINSLSSLNLSLNSLSGNIPASFNKFSSLVSLNLSSNNFTGFLADSLHMLTEISNISMYYNNLTFEDFEDKKELFDLYFYYSPQYKIGQNMVISADTGANYTLNMACGGTQNLYQWFFNGNVLSERSPSPEYEITNIGEEDIGDYTCKVTNTLVPGLILESHPITIQFKPVGDQPPTNITLTNRNIDEMQPVGTEIGIFEAIDADFDDEHFFTMNEGEGGEHNRYFFIAGNKLYSAEEFDFEQRNAYNIRVQAIDRAGNTFVKQFSIGINDIEELPPSDILLSNNTIQENLRAGKLIGTFSTISYNDTLTTEAEYAFAITDHSADNDSFFIAANQLRSNVVFDYETTDSCLISVEATDQNGLTLVKIFTIYIIDDESDNNQEGNNNEDEEPDEFFIPDAFSPNADGYNDRFVIEGLEPLAPASIIIYNRSGTMIYNHTFTNNDKSESFHWWDGSLNNNGSKPLPEGYYYLIATLKNNEQHKKSIYLRR